MRILLVEQDSRLRHLLATDIEERGHEVIEAADGLAGLRLLEQGAPDAVLINIVAPGGDAIEHLNALRVRGRSGNRSGIPLVTYLDRDEPLLRASARIALLMGARGAFMKPLDLDRVLEALGPMGGDSPPGVAPGDGKKRRSPPEKGA